MNQVARKIYLGMMLVLIIMRTAALYGQQPDHPMAMPSPTPKASATPPKTDMPGMPMPTAQPTASPQTPTNMPGMSMPRPSPTPAANPTNKMPGMDMGGTNANMSMGALLVDNGNEMAIRVGASTTNVLSMSAMGSGTSLLPSSS